MLGFSSISEYSISEVPSGAATLPDYSGTGTPPSYPVPLPDLPNERHHRIMLARSAALAMQGKTNNVIQTFTLGASTTQTTLSHPLVGYFSYIALMPQTSTAAAVDYWITDQTQGSAVVNHASDASTTRTFRVVVIG